MKKKTLLALTMVFLLLFLGLKVAYSQPPRSVVIFSSRYNMPPASEQGNNQVRYFPILYPDKIDIGGNRDTVIYRHYSDVENKFQKEPDEDKGQPANNVNVFVQRLKLPIVHFENVVFQDHIDTIKQLKDNFRWAVIAGIYNELLDAEGEQEERLREALNLLISLDPEEWAQAGELLEEFDFYQNLVEEYETQIKDIARAAYDSITDLSFRDVMKDLVGKYNFPWISFPGVCSGYTGLARKDFLPLFREFQNKNITGSDIDSFEEFYNLLPDWIKDPWARIETEALSYTAYMDMNFRKVE